MNEAEKFIEDLIADLPATEQTEARAILRSGNFSDASDPVLALLRYQQLREKTAIETGRTKAAFLTKLVGEMRDLLYQAAKIKLSFVGILLTSAFLLSFVLMCCLMEYQVRTNPRQMSSLLGLADPRMAELQRDGVSLEVYDQQGEVGVYLKGKLANMRNDQFGNAVVVFHKQP